MTHDLVAFTELTDAELDAVAAGATPVATALNNLVGVAVALGVDNVSVLNNNRITITDVASHNVVTVGAGVAVAALGGAAGVINHF